MQIEFSISYAGVPPFRVQATQTAQGRTIVCTRKGQRIQLAKWAMDDVRQTVDRHFQEMAQTPTATA